MTAIIGSYIITLPSAYGAMPWTLRFLCLCAEGALADMVVPANTSSGVVTVLGFVCGTEAVTVTSRGWRLENSTSMPTMKPSSDLTILWPSNSVVISPITDAGMQTIASTHMTKAMGPLEDAMSLQVDTYTLSGVWRDDLTFAAAS